MNFENNQREVGTVIANRTRTEYKKNSRISPPQNKKHLKKQ